MPMTTEGALIRPAMANDLPACAAIINEYIDATDWLPRTLSRAEIADAFSPGLLTKRRVLVAEDGGELVGYLTMGEDGVLPAIYLAPRSRGRGIGKAMIDRAKEISPGHIELTVFEPNRSAQRFYLREGFVPVPEGRNEETPEGVPTLRLRWEAAG